ncbi:MAG: hypothetical protein QMD86_00730 [Patescibacteria group bacterium]|nr:hypothetical protein [Patescibacteria group bacterium]
MTGKENDPAKTVFGLGLLTGVLFEKLNMERSDNDVFVPSVDEFALIVHGLKRLNENDKIFKVNAVKIEEENATLIPWHHPLSETSKVFVQKTRNFLGIPENHSDCSIKEIEMLIQHAESYLNEMGLA